MRELFLCKDQGPFGCVGDPGPKCPWDPPGTVKILGAAYTIQFKSDEEVCAAVNCDAGDCGGYCNHSAKQIVIARLDKGDGSEEEKGILRKLNLRHEIVHGFLQESGLAYNANASDCWATNEEMVDWFAIQGPKIYQAWEEARAL